MALYPLYRSNRTQAKGHAWSFSGSRELSDALDRERALAIARNRLPFAKLDEFLHSSDFDKRRAALGKLAQEEDSRPEIEALASDPDWEIRGTAACALKRIGGSEEVLERLRHDADLIVRGCAKWL